MTTIETINMRPYELRRDETNLKAIGGNIMKFGYPTLGDFGLGIGGIDPSSRTDIDPVKYKEMLDKIAAGDFNIPVSETIPVICVDGRLDANGSRLEMPSIAGSSLGLAYARILGDKGTLDGQTELSVVKNTITALKNMGHEVSVHGDDHSECGCGACANCKGVFEHIASDINSLSAAAGALGFKISNAKLISENARNKLDEGFLLEDRAKVLAFGQELGALYENLEGPHFELGIAENKRPNTTISRVAIREAYGPGYDVFVVDTWSFKNGIALLKSPGDDEDTVRGVEGAAIYNIATASKLSHESMPIVSVAA